ncbi:hypothetical protein [Corynebacterium sp. HMSC065A05]|nr:hypothetical protein [Corynebacterium sp. HMSC065A05]
MRSQGAINPKLDRKARHEAGGFATEVAFGDKEAVIEAGECGLENDVGFVRGRAASEEGAGEDDAGGSFGHAELECRELPGKAKGVLGTELKVGHDEDGH